MEKYGYIRVSVFHRSRVTVTESADSERVRRRYPCKDCIAFLFSKNKPRASSSGKYELKSSRLSNDIKRASSVSPNKLKSNVSKLWKHGKFFISPKLITVRLRSFGEFSQRLSHRGEFESVSLLRLPNEA